MEKLTEVQQEVIDLMKAGWELGQNESGAMNKRSWLQKDGLGRGGESKKISSATVQALILKKVIKKNYKFPVSRFELCM